MTQLLKNILLVEDEALIALSEKIQLEHKGYRVFHVSSGERAVEFVQTRIEPIDIVLMDIDLGGGIDGTEAARQILKSNNLPVLFLSSHSETEIVEKTETITNYGYVVKNSSITVLDASIKMACKLFSALQSINDQRMEMEAAYEQMQVSNDDLTRTQQELMTHEKVLRDSEERYRLLFTEMLEGFALHEIICDAAGVPVDYRFLAMNPAFEKLTGLRTSEVIGKTLLEILPETESYWIESYGRVALTGESIRFENYSIEFDKTYQVAAFCPKKGQFAVLFSDVTERRAAEHALRKEHAVMDMIMETSPVGITTVDARGAITYANSTAEKILGLTKDDITSRDYNAPAWNSTGLDGKPFPDESQPFSIIKTTLKSAYDIKHAILWPDGRRVMLSVNASPLLDDSGAFLGMVATIDDITERQHAETRINKLLQEKDAILKEVHHRVKNNMSTMCSLLRLQADERVNEETRGILQDAIGRLDSMEVLYDKLYRSENANSMSIKEYFTALIEEIVGLFPRKAKISIETRFDDFMVDAKLLSSLGIVMNELITNSMKHAFIGRSEGVLSVSASRENNRAVIVFKDNGIGVPEAISFENSTGFGMQLMKILIEQIGGTIEAQRGEGTCFQIECGLGNEAPRSV
ncbi:MAG: hypothetical protein A2Y38_18465 [Spirochaetes bacterium GWB1_59_5]|nr:MAG: hypothetical protein A2Y38_18465 [Spirochaetes bacterium GWB1_59_5]